MGRNFRYESLVPKISTARGYPVVDCTVIEGSKEAVRRRTAPARPQHTNDVQTQRCLPTKLIQSIVRNPDEARGPRHRTKCQTDKPERVHSLSKDHQKWIRTSIIGKGPGDKNMCAGIWRRQYSTRKRCAQWSSSMVKFTRKYQNDEVYYNHKRNSSPFSMARNCSA